MTLTGPAEVSIGSSFHVAAPAAVVRSSGCTASQIFFFCTLLVRGREASANAHRCKS